MGRKGVKGLLQVGQEKVPHGFGLRTRDLTSSQDGGVGRHTVPPYTTKRRTTTNLKAKHNHNCQKIKLHGSLTTKELEGTFIQTSRRDGDGQPGWRGLVARQQLEVHAGKAAAGGAGSPMFA